MVRWLTFLGIVCVSCASYFIPLSLPHDAHVVFAILVLAALLWVTETIPLFQTSLLITVLLVLFKIFSFSEAVRHFADPILVLFFGGFLIAQAMQRIKLDTVIARYVTGHVTSARVALLAVMCTTAFLSMWISNTASTVVMIPIALGIVAKVGRRMTEFAKAMVLGVAFSANIGGIGTIIGSPPNAIAVAQLAEFTGSEITFLGWMLHAIPLVLVLIPVSWGLLMWMFPFTQRAITTTRRVPALTREQKLFIGVFCATVALWLTTRVHGLSSSLIALLGALALFFVSLLDASDLKEINYGVLLLFGGGLVLGKAMFSTGVSSYFATLLGTSLANAPLFLVLASIAIASILFGALASNTATAAVLIPVLLPLAGMVSLSPKLFALLGGIAVSLDFLLPVGTPPNAIAYATETITIRDMLKAGSILTICAVIALVGVSFFWL